ncbi:Gustatory receptor for sugar taste 43a [Frankliniella fusca]|uniref:Gustatory receptor for sugar taste 43a n=1 Tax=Frankliniella fusca TaxID=407009 RepID=A0AAE1GRI2_9NEOP|nr:Gustatory receptor for sugar taste 43a [Frankliniella fusca]
MFRPFVDVLDKLSIDMDDARLVQSVSLFYHTICAYPATLTVSGFTSMGRPLLTSVLSATVTYIVILVQFQQDEAQMNQIPNSTDSNNSSYCTHYKQLLRNDCDWEN